MTEQILSRLLGGQSVSGQALSEELGVTRAAVWKQISQLREMGFEIEACGGQGYRLVSCPDSLMEPVVQQGLHTAWAGKKIVYLRSVDSTNRYARQLAADGAEQGTLVLADEQTAGRGRRGRGWISPAGEGIFMTLILRPHARPMLRCCRCKRRLRSRGRFPAPANWMHASSGPTTSSAAAERFAACCWR